MVSVSEDGVIVFWCPGCKTYHGVWTQRPNDLTGSKWTWNGDRQKPTFNPSILVHPGDHRPRCHSFVQDGMIQFCDDSGHALAGKTVRLEAP